MLRSSLDHIVITVPSLAEGVAYIEDILGVSTQVGGQHPRMGTHNRLLKLGERCYLEVIAIDPQAQRPQRPRWFQLDRFEPSTPIRLATWVARSNDIMAAASVAPFALGAIEAMSRGRLNWSITIPDDGSLPCAGIAPALIQWPDGVHPADTLLESGCRLVSLKGFHPQATRIIGFLNAIGFTGDYQAFELPLTHAPYLEALIETPTGLRQIGGPIA